MIDLTCPNCQEDFEAEFQPWDFEDICPHCNVNLYANYDFTEMTDGDEWPHWYLSVVKR